MRVFNNFDGYMYTRYNLSLGVMIYENRIYILDIEEESRKLISLLEEKGILYSILINRGHYLELVYKYNENSISDELVKAGLHKEEQQWKATILNYKHYIHNKREIEK